LIPLTPRPPGGGGTAARAVAPRARGLARAVPWADAGVGGDIEDSWTEERTAVRGVDWSDPVPPRLFRGRLPEVVVDALLLVGRRTADMADIVRVRVGGGMVLIVVVAKVAVSVVQCRGYEVVVNVNKSCQAA
jgi:hypothetical protein